MRSRWFATASFPHRRRPKARSRASRSRIVTELAREDGIPVEQRPIDRSELYIADELALTGTLAEITPISAIDEMALPAEVTATRPAANTLPRGGQGIRSHTSAMR